MVGCIIPKFCPEKKRVPSPWLLVNQATQILLYTAIDDFGLTIHLWMVCKAHLQLCAWQLKEFTPKIAYKNRIMVTNDRVGHAV
jgi:hypothetical protein